MCMYLTVQHHICSLRIPFEPPMQSVIYLIVVVGCNITIDEVIFKRLFIAALIVSWRVSSKFKTKELANYNNIVVQEM